MSLDKNGVGVLCSYDNSLGGYLQVNGEKVIRTSDLTSIQTAITGLQGKTLWTNSSPSSSWSSKNITLSDGNYDLLLWCFRRLNTNSAITIEVFNQRNRGSIITTADTSGNLVRRGIAYVSGATYTVQDSVIGNTTSNGWLRPLYVVGFKIGRF